MRWYVAENVEWSEERIVWALEDDFEKIGGLRVEGTDSVGFGTNEVVWLVGRGVYEAVTNPFGHLDAGFDISLGDLGDKNDFKLTPLILL